MSKKRSTRRLPRKLSALIRVALHDEMRAFKSKDYKINMSVWHEPNTTQNVCEVCLAGSVIAFTLGAKPGRTSYPDRFPSQLDRELCSLDFIRKGMIAKALQKYHGEPEWGVCYQPIPPKKGWRDLQRAIGAKLGRMPTYTKERMAWRKWLFRCANQLEKAGE